MVTLDFVYPLAHIITAKYWHNLDESSLHLTIADTGWLKAIMGKTLRTVDSGGFVCLYMIMLNLLLQNVWK